MVPGGNHDKTDIKSHSFFIQKDECSTERINLPFGHAFYERPWHFASWSVTNFHECCPPFSSDGHIRCHSGPREQWDYLAREQSERNRGWNRLTEPGKNSHSFPLPETYPAISLAGCSICSYPSLFPRLSSLRVRGPWSIGTACWTRPMRY